MRKLLTVMVALPLFVGAFGMSASNQVLAKQIAVKMKPECPTGLVDATKNLKLIAPIPAPSAARRRRGPKERDDPVSTRLKKPAAGNCG
jgi:hypothetical protein